MRYDWDEKKNTLNIAKHSISFECIYDADWTQAYALLDTPKDYGEMRIMALVPIAGRLHAVVYVKRSNIRRIISVRKANLRERKFYAQVKA